MSLVLPRFTGGETPSVDEWNAFWSDIESAVNASVGGVVALVAGATLGGHRIVTLDGNGHAIHADSSDPTTIEQVVGMTAGAAASGASVNVQPAGEMNEPSWNFTPGAVWLGINGQPTQTAPNSGVLLQIGTALSATRLLIHLEPPIYLQ